MAGEAGIFMLGNTVGPAGGADIGQVRSRGVCGCGRLVSMGAGLGLLAFSLPFSSLSSLSSVRAVDGALSIWSLFSFSESSVSVVVLLALLALLALLRALLVLLTVLVVLAVLVRFRRDFPVCGGEARQGDTSDMPLRKSRYATGGVMGVFRRSCSSLIVALKGPAEGRPAEGSPAEGMGSRKADVREMAERGVLRETADGSDTADRSSEADGGIWGKFAVRGVETRRLGLADMLAVRRREEDRRVSFGGSCVELVVDSPRARMRGDPAVGWER